MGEHQLMQAGFEASAALALVTTALIFHQDTTYVNGLEAQIAAHTQTIQFLEDDIAKLKQAAADEGISVGEHQSALQAQLEEATSESNMFQVLNDVIRKSSAKLSEEKESLSDRLLQSDRKVGQLLAEVDQLQKEVSRVENDSGLIQQNSQLFKELNEARVKESQTHLINETLVRMHRTESMKAKQQQEDLEALLKQVKSQEIEAEKIGRLEADLASVQQNKTAIEQELEQKKQECAMLSTCSIGQEQEKMLLEKIDQMGAAHEQVQTLQTRLDQMGAAHEQVQTLQTRLDQYTEMELLYRQLKTSFEEKNVILHQTRVELFKTDTQLQTLQQEMQQKTLEVDPVLPELLSEIGEIEKENQVLHEENTLLQDLVSSLMAQSPEPKKKGKKPEGAVQQDLFNGVNPVFIQSRRGSLRGPTPSDKD
jgi:DNA repair exonuclease SbcCD ATPase subunit